MYQKDFEKLRVENLCGRTDGLNVGDYFLSTELENQKNTKKVGDEVTVYRVTELRPPLGFSYTPCYIVLE